MIIRPMVRPSALQKYTYRYLSTADKYFVPDNEKILKGNAPIMKRVDAYLRLARFDKQIGTKLLLLPCFWSISLAAVPGALPSLYTMSLFTVGALSARSAGCAINDYWDLDIDKSVERTKYRPVTTGEITKVKALGFFGALTGTCFAIAYSLPPLVTSIGLLCVPLVVAYPRFKRFFKYPQGMLGVTFNMGVFMGYAAIKNVINLKVLGPLYIGSILWTIVYDTIYAFQDISYDKKIGLKSCAIEFEKNPKLILGSLAALSTGCMGLAGYLAGLHPIYYMFLAGAASHYSWQISTLDIKNVDRCKNMFLSNQYLGILILFGFIMGRYYQQPKEKEE